MVDILALSKVCTERGSTPSDQRERLLKLIEFGADVHAADKNGVTALHHAVRFRSPAAVSTLIEFGADVNRACRRSGATPLHRAVTSSGAPGTTGKRAESIEIVRLLIRAGADPSIPNKLGKVPLAYAKAPEIRQLLGAG